MKRLILLISMMAVSACCFAQDPNTLHDVGKLFNCASSKPLAEAVQKCNVQSDTTKSFYHMMTYDGHEYVFARRAGDRTLQQVKYRVEGDNITIYNNYPPDQWKKTFTRRIVNSDYKSEGWAAYLQSRKGIGN